MKIAMIVLAAGLSERMGAPKPLLPVGQESALLRAVGLGRAERVHSISVVTGFKRELVEAELSACRAKNVRHIYNAAFAEGMFSSVKAGVHSLPHDIDGFFLLPVDHCAVAPGTIEKLIAAFVLSGGREVIYPTFEGRRGHPPLIPYAFASGIRSYSGEGGMRGYLETYPGAEVETGDKGVVLDMDTPRDYAALLRHLNLPTYPEEAECFRLLEKHGAPESVVQHGVQVRDTALRIARKLSEKGVRINETLLASACLLHDIARGQPDHARNGALTLLSEGYPDAAMAVEAHMDLPEGQDGPDEAVILYLADKLVRGGRVVPLDETLALLRERYASDPEALGRAVARMARAQSIADMLERKYGVELDFLFNAEHSPAEK